MFFEATGENFFKRIIYSHFCLLLSKTGFVFVFVFVFVFSLSRGESSQERERERERESFFFLLFFLSSNTQPFWRGVGLDDVGAFVAFLPPSFLLSLSLSLGVKVT